MRIAVLGTGMVGETLASKLVALGHEVAMGSRSADNPKAVAWATKVGARGRAATFADAARGADLVINATLGAASVDALRACGDALDGAIVVDVSNPLDFGTQPPSLTVANTTSLAEQLQAAVPGARVVKALNTMTAALMVDPRAIEGEHAVFVCGDDADAKRAVRDLLAGFGWREGEIVDLGELAAARGTEAYLLLWLRIWKATGTGMFNVAIRR